MEESNATLKVRGFSCQLLGECTCGAVFVVHVIAPNGSLRSVCPKCQTRWTLESATFTNRVGDEPMRLTTQCKFEIPNIIQPAGRALVKV